MSANMEFAYLDAGGTHSAASIIKGAQDGRDQLKALAPAAVRFMVPKLKYVVVRRDDAPAAPLSVSALRGGKPVEGFNIQYLGDLPAFSLADLKKVKADAVRIEGGAYTLLAMPKPGKGALADKPLPAQAAKPAP